VANRARRASQSPRHCRGISETSAFHERERINAIAVPALSKADAAARHCSNSTIMPSTAPPAVRSTICGTSGSRTVLPNDEDVEPDVALGGLRTVKKPLQDTGHPVQDTRHPRAGHRTPCRTSSRSAAAILRLQAPPFLPARSGSLPAWLRGRCLPSPLSLFGIPSRERRPRNNPRFPPSVLLRSSSARAQDAKRSGEYCQAFWCGACGTRSLPSRRPPIRINAFGVVSVAGSRASQPIRSPLARPFLAAYRTGWRCLRVERLLSSGHCQTGA